MTSSACLRFTLVVCFCFSSAWTANLDGISGQRSAKMTVVYPRGTTVDNFRTCGSGEVCNRLDTYSNPWLEKRCSCNQGFRCSTSLQANDGHTLTDRQYLYKMCEPVDSLPTCEYFRNITWTYVTNGSNQLQQQLVHCRCPPHSIAYLKRHEAKMDENGSIFFQFHFACSPISVGHLCQKKEPCRLFTVVKRYPVEEVTTDKICRCPSKLSCPRHHWDSNVIMSESGMSSGKVYCAYCGVDLTSENES